eukprot:5316880-Prymnesium_polylepis.3
MSASARRHITAHANYAEQRVVVGPHGDAVPLTFRHYKAKIRFGGGEWAQWPVPVCSSRM